MRLAADSVWLYLNRTIQIMATGIIEQMNLSDTMSLPITLSDAVQGCYKVAALECRSTDLPIASMKLYRIEFFE